MLGLKDKLTGAGYGLGWSVVCRLPQSWARRGFRSAADIAWRRRGLRVKVLEGNLRRVIGGNPPDEQLRALSRETMRSYAVLTGGIPASGVPGRAASWRDA
jgi:KDO2-lipid IV(A) lauroyltransferase